VWGLSGPVSSSGVLNQVMMNCNGDWGSEKIVCGMKVEHEVELIRGKDNVYKIKHYPSHGLITL
jgi:hypothetical protein